MPHVLVIAGWMQTGQDRIASAEVQPLGRMASWDGKNKPF
jgi:hypothetical protein